MPLPPFVLSDLTHGNATPDYRLGDARAQFYLTYSGIDLAIHEPVGWDACEWVLLRDKEFHGINFEYTGEEATLRFREQAAIDFIESAYQTDGPSAEVRLRWELTYGPDVLPLQTLKLNFLKRVKKGAELTIAGERLSLFPDIKARWDATLSMDQRAAIINDADNNPLPIVPPAPVQLILHSQRIEQGTATKPLPAKQDTDWQAFANSGGNTLQTGQILNGLTGTKVFRNFYLSLPMEGGDMPGFVGSQIGISTDNPVDAFRPILVTPAEGNFDFKLTIDFQVDARLQRAAVSLNPPDIDSFSLTCVFVANGKSYPIAPAQSGNINNGRFLGVKRMSSTFALKLDLPAKSPVYAYALLTLNPNRSNWRGTDVRLLAYNSTFSVSGNTTAPASTTGAYPIIDVLKHMTACLTGRSNAVQSVYYSPQSASQPVDGGGSRRVISNGFGLRGFGGKPAQSSLKNFLSALQAIDAIGLSYRPTSAGEVIVIEPIANFYRDIEIMRFGSYTVIEEETKADYIHPSVLIGYDKFPDAGPQVLDEFNTRHEYVLPGRGGTVYNQTSSLIASGYAIEQTRRQQFAEKPTDSTASDDDLFIICVNPDGKLTSASTSATVRAKFALYSGKASLLIDVELTPAWLAKGLTIQVSGSAANSGVFRIVDLLRSKLPQSGIGTGIGIGGSLRMATVLTLDRAITPEIGNVTLSIGTTGGGSYIAERSESFGLVKGVVDPETVYNLRLSPRFNLLRHGRYIAGGLVYEDGAEPIKCVFTKNNGMLRTRLNDNAEGDLSIDIRRVIQHNDTLYVSDLRELLPPIWTPETVKVSTKLTLDQMLYLRACLQGFHPDLTKHYGYVTLAGKTAAEDVLLYPLEIRLKPSTGECILTGLKKFVPLSPSGQRGCSFYASYTFEQFEAAQAGVIDPFIEGCIFGGFQ